MNRRLKSILVAASMAMAFNGQTRAADDALMDVGKQEYDDKCAVCHGQNGKGKGPIADMLKVAPSDLTILTKNNGGVFPFGRVYGVIDGRQVVKLHGERSMPVWGRSYLSDEAGAKNYFADTKVPMELYVRLRILALIDYLNRLQAK